MILNARTNMFAITLPRDFLYPEVSEKWAPYVQKLKLPFENTIDFLNASIQSITLPDINIPYVEQQQGQYKSVYTGGKELEPVVDKSLTIQFKLTESFLSYWIFYDQIQEYLKYNTDGHDPYWPDVSITFLDNNGHTLIEFKYKMIIPTSISSIKISYNKTVVEYDTFNVGLRYNRYDVSP